MRQTEVTDKLDNEAAPAQMTSTDNQASQSTKKPVDEYEFDSSDEEVSAF